MAPILYTNGMSPPCRAVLLTAKAIDLELEVKMINMFNKEHLEPDYVQMNPLHTVPMLDDGDDFFLTDSHAINSYLIGQYGSGHEDLYPTDLRQRAIVDQRLFFNSGTLQPLARQIVKPLFHEGATAVDEKSIESVTEAYGHLETFLQGKTWFAGDSVTIADFSLISSITSLNVLVPIDGDAYPSLIEWIKSAEDLSYYAEGNGEGLEAFKALIDGLIA